MKKESGAPFTIWNLITGDIYPLIHVLTQGYVTDCYTILMCSDFCFSIILFEWVMNILCLYVSIGQPGLYTFWSLNERERMRERGMNYTFSTCWVYLMVMWYDLCPIIGPLAVCLFLIGQSTCVAYGARMVWQLLHNDVCRYYFIVWEWEFGGHKVYLNKNPVKINLPYSALIQ